MTKAATNANGAPGTGGDLADLDAVVRAELARWGIPGIAVGTLHRGEVRLRAFGAASVETGQPVAPGTLFQIGSITKVFLTTLAMRLVDQGLLDLDTPVATYLPELKLQDPAVQAGVTFRHLVTHTSGILGDHFPDYGLGDDVLVKTVAGMADLPQVTPLGGPWSYCNSGFYLAGHVIERLTGKPFETAMAEQIFAPLGLDRTTFWAHEAITHSAAVGHLQEGGKPPVVARPYPLARCANPAGGIISCTRDLLRFAAFHLAGGKAGGRPDGEQVVQAASVAAMQAVQTTVNDASEWGLGWSLGRVAGVRTLGHGGGTNGFITQLTVVPEREYAIAVLTNSSRGGAAIRPIINWALEHECGLPHVAPARATLTEAQLQRLAGTYVTALARMTVTPEQGNLRVEAVGINPFTKQERTLPVTILEPLSEWTFIAGEGEMAGTRVEFLPGPDGTPAHGRFGGRLSARQT